MYVKFLGGWDGLLLKSELKNKQELMWSAAVLRLINGTFLFQKIYCQEEGKTLTRSGLYVEELCSFQFSWGESFLRCDVVSCCVEVDKQDFPVSEDILLRRRQDTDEVRLVC